MRDLLSIERATRELQGRKHVVELQSLRGIAAMVVLVHHCTFYYSYDPSLKHVAEVALNAHAAVVSFFVLSGFVLTASLSRRHIDFRAAMTFYLRRAFRIYPALWLACGLALAYAVAFRHSPVPDYVSAWWRPKSRQVPGAAMTLLSVMGVHTPLAVPIWSLFVELIGSLLMPVIAWLLFRRVRLFLMLTAAFAVLSQFGAMNALTNAPIFLADFTLGAAIVLLSPALASRLRGDAVALGSAVAGFAALWFGRHLFLADFMNHYDSPPAALVEAVGATILITVIYTRADLFAFLRWRAIVWLGDISYSLYLVHMTILGLVAGVAGEVLHLWPFTEGSIAATSALVAVTMALSIAIAALSYRFVEVPFVRLGKKLVPERGVWRREPATLTPACEPSVPSRSI